MQFLYWGCWWSITIILSYGRLLKVENNACQINIREEFLGRHITKYMYSWRPTEMYTPGIYSTYDSTQIHTKSYTFFVDQLCFHSVFNAWKMTITNCQCIHVAIFLVGYLQGVEPIYLCIYIAYLYTIWIVVSLIYIFI